MNLPKLQRFQCSSFQCNFILFYLKLFKMESVKISFKKSLLITMYTVNSILNGPYKCLLCNLQVGFYLQTTKFSLKLEIKSNTPKTYAISHKTLLFVSNFKENHTLWEQEFSLKFETLQAIHLKPTRFVIKHCFFIQSLKRTLSFEDRNPPVIDSFQRFDCSLWFALEYESLEN